MVVTKRVDRVIGKLICNPIRLNEKGIWKYKVLLKDQTKFKKVEIPISVNLTEKQYQEKKEELKKGGKIFVDGFKGYSPFEDVDGKMRFESTVNAKFISILI